jgi:hypothetical protein
MTTEMLTDAEFQAVKDIARAWNAIIGITGDGQTRKADLAEACAHIHALHNMVLAQAAARCYPGQFRLLGEIIYG